MATERDKIPRPLERDVKTEAGHRCSIPTCRATAGLQIHHIVPWAKVKKHTFDNLILLCSNCHSRVTGGEIDTLSVKHYKANLSVVTQRYGDLERRVLELFAQHPEADLIELPGGQDLLLWYLLRDGFLVKKPNTGQYLQLNGRDAVEAYVLTATGKDFVQRWVSAREDLE